MNTIHYSRFHGKFRYICFVHGEVLEILLLAVITRVLLRRIVAIIAIVGEYNHGKRQLSM